MNSARLKLALPVLLALALAAAGDRKLTDAEWARVKKGEIISEVKNEGGTQSGAWAAGWFAERPEAMFRAVSSLERYDETMDRVTVSVLLDEATKEKVVKSGLTDADQVEKLFAGMQKNWRKDLGGGKYLVYSYQRNDLPWPANDRWILLELIHDPATLTQTWKRLCGNIKQDWGSWRMSAAPGGGTLGIMIIHLDLDIAATGPFTAFAMEVSIPETYAGLRKVAAQQARQK